jgi:hypothetical protein
MQMSSVAERPTEPPLLTKIFQFLHFWSAYRAETYLAGAPPPGIIIATQAHTLLPPEPVATTPAAPISIASGQPHLPLILPVAVSTEQAVDIIPPVSKNAPASALATQREPQNFQLPARLHSVSKLNRIALPVVKSARASSKHATIVNRASRSVLTAKTSWTIQPPAVLRKKRRTAEILHLNLEMAHAESRRANDARSSLHNSIQRLRARHTLCDMLRQLKA